MLDKKIHDFVQKTFNADTYLNPRPNFSVPKVPMPFRRKLKTSLFSLRTPTLKV